MAASDEIWIGGRAASNQVFDGSIDEVRIYTEALTQAQIDSFTAPPTLNNLDWRFNHCRSI